MSAPGRPGDSSSRPSTHSENAVPVDEVVTDVLPGRPRRAQVDVGEQPTTVLSPRPWDPSDVNTDKLISHPTEVSETQTTKLTPDISEIHTAELPSLPSTHVSRLSAPTPPRAFPASIAPAAPYEAFQGAPDAIDMTTAADLRSGPDLRPATPVESADGDISHTPPDTLGPDLPQRYFFNVVLPLPPPPKRVRLRLNRATRVYATAVVAALLVVMTLLSAAGLVARQQQEAVVRAFCDALRARDYIAAYDLLSTPLQSHLPQATFVRASEIHDDVDDPVMGCQLAESAAPPDGLGALDPRISSESLALMIQRATTWRGSLTLVRQGLDWRIAQIAPELEGSDIEPIVLAQSFCAALVAGDFHIIYGLFSPAARTATSEQEFTQALSDLFSDGGNIKVVRCTPVVSSYTHHDATARVKASVATLVNGVPGSVPLTFSLVYVNNAWTIDSFDDRS